MVSPGTIGWRVKKARQALDLTQVQLSEKCGLLPVTISRLEQQQHHTYIQLGTLVPIAQALGVTLDGLVWGSRSEL